MCECVFVFMSLGGGWPNTPKTAQLPPLYSIVIVRLFSCPKHAETACPPEHGDVKLNEDNPGALRYITPLFRLKASVTCLDEDLSGHRQGYQSHT